MKKKIVQNRSLDHDFKEDVLKIYHKSRVPKQIPGMDEIFVKKTGKKKKI